MKGALFTLTESELDNMLVDQKNRIFRLINDGNLVAAQASLDTVRDLWTALSYGYKVFELQKRINEEIGRITDEAKKAL